MATFVILTYTRDYTPLSNAHLHYDIAFTAAHFPPASNAVHPSSNTDTLTNQPNNTVSLSSWSRLSAGRRLCNDKGHNDYERDSTRKLALSDALRGLKVTYPSNGKMHLLDPSTSIESPQRDDKSTPFRFFDLPPELRNMIYDNLLLFEGTSLTCHPQILASCKRTRGEATGILYGKNLITINIHQDRVEAHGVNCGSYIPLMRRDAKPEDPPNKLTSIQWPHFLRRIESIEITAPSPIWGSDYRHMEAVTARRRSRAINNILCSLCSTLRSEGHKCRNLRTFVQQALHGANTTPREKLIAMYPLRLLSMKEYILLPQTPDQVVVKLSDSKAQHQATMLRTSLSLLQGKAVLISRIIDLYSRMLEHFARASWWHRNVQSTRFFVKMSCIYWTLKLSSSSSKKKWWVLLDDEVMDRMLEKYVAWLRDQAAGRGMDGRGELLEEIDEFLMLEIELRASGSGVSGAGEGGRSGWWWKGLRHKVHAVMRRIGLGV